jgi:single-stranded DNA-binding protein
MSIECALSGRLGNQMQRHTKRGDRFLTFSVAINYNAGTEWVQVAVFSPVLDEMQDELIRGERLYIEGKLKVNRWENAEGAHANLAVTASKVVILDRIGRRARRPKRPKPANPMDNVIPFSDDGVDDDPGFDLGETEVA